ncbi:MAG: hypothetical protein JWL68_3256, partial [Actinomycetia bacterium]|nr:hypothetical protein [Actinomycetes bacterium]
MSTASPVGTRGDASTDKGSASAASAPNSSSGNQYPRRAVRSAGPELATEPA